MRKRNPHHGGGNSPNKSFYRHNNKIKRFKVRHNNGGPNTRGWFQVIIYYLALASICMIASSVVLFLIHWRRMESSWVLSLWNAEDIMLLQHHSDYVNLRSNNNANRKNKVVDGSIMMSPTRATEEETININTVELVVAYCNIDLSWMIRGVLHQIPKTITTIRITVLSKCGHDKNSYLPIFQIHDHRVVNVEVENLSNVGGCDYAYAHFINRYIETHTTRSLEDAENMNTNDDADADASSSVILFIKDTPRSRRFLHMPRHERFRSVGEMIHAASRGNFICGAKLDCELSPYHDTAALYRFTKTNYTRRTNLLLKVESMTTEDQPFFNTHKYEDLRDFHTRALHWEFPNAQLTRVCYGGTFAVPASQIIALSKVPNTRNAMKLLEYNLQRNASTTIEEHFAERSWGGLLSTPLDEKESDIVQKTKDRIMISKLDQGKTYGALANNHKSTCTFPQYAKKLYVNMRSNLQS